MTQQRRNLFRFEAGLQDFARRVEIDVGVVTRRVVLDVHNKIVLRTPVDTGRARASWGIEPRGFGEYVMPKGTSLSAANAASMAQRQQSKLGAGSRNPYTPWWIFNNLPYIVELEYGSSKQAPAGMVRVALAEVSAGLEVWGR
jgi:hypothetical protein